MLTFFSFRSSTLFVLLFRTLVIPSQETGSSLILFELSISDELSRFILGGNESYWGQLCAKCVIIMSLRRLSFLCSRDMAGGWEK